LTTDAPSRYADDEDLASARFHGRKPGMILVALSALTLFLVIATTLRLRWWWRALALIPLLFTGVVLWNLVVPQIGQIRGGSTFDSTQSPWKEIIAFVTMVLGMNAKYLWDLTDARKQKNAKLKPGETKHGLGFDAWDFVQPLLVAGIVFGTILETIKQLNATTLIFSFQNGFFWQTIFKKHRS
jgi:hypothetical protein